MMRTQCSGALGKKLMVAACLCFCAGVHGESAPSAGAPADAPWWRQQKINFMWGQWNHARTDQSGSWWTADLPPQLFRNIAMSGATVFAECRGYKPEHARLAQRLGMRYFATRYNCDLPHLRGRDWIRADGEVYRGGKDESSPKWKCPLDESVYAKWLLEPLLEGLGEGLIDGIHTDWENYGGNGDATGPCYCDRCFAGFIQDRHAKGKPPGPAQRHGFLQQRDLVGAYEAHFHARRVEMFAGIRRKLQSLNPDLLFSCYGQTLSDFTRAMHTQRNPLIVLDPLHYYNDDRQPWWESYGPRIRAEGYLYIPGGWTNSLFGAQISQVSAARWLYEAAINQDGCWLWFERELDDEILRAYAAASRAIKAVEAKVGKFLFVGDRDPHFVTAVEWSGRPELAQAALTQTYHLADEHLTHVNNVNTEWPLRVRIRFPQIPAGGRWTLRDPLSGIYYCPDRQSASWGQAELKQGVVLAIEPRSDLFLLLSPAPAGLHVEPERLVASAGFSALPQHADASAHARPPEAIEGPADPVAEGTSPTGSAQAASGRLVYTATEPMGFRGPEGPMTIGNVMRSWDLSDGHHVRLRQLRGHIWDPRRSPDGERITFVHDAGGRGQIFAINQDGSAPVNLSNNRHCDRSPTWSADGRRIAFVSDRGGDWDIWTMNADGSGQRRLAGNPGRDRAPAWSPDGQRLLWESHAAGTTGLWLCDADGGNSRPLLVPGRPFTYVPQFEGDRPPDIPDHWHYLRNAAWSPDGARIAAAGLWNVVVLDADGSRLQEVIHWMMGTGPLAWSPDGRLLAGTAHTAPAETERSGVFVLEPGQGGYRWLVATTATGPRLGGAKRNGLNTWYAHGSARPRRVVKSFGSLAWSADGTALAFSSDMAPNGAFHVYTVAIDAGEPERLEASRSAWPNQISW